MFWSQYRGKRLRTTGILWGISSGDFSQFFGIRHRVESGSEGRDRLGHHGLNVFDTSRKERHRALFLEGKSFA